MADRPSTSSSSSLICPRDRRLGPSRAVVLQNGRPVLGRAGGAARRCFGRARRQPSARRSSWSRSAGVCTARCGGCSTYAFLHAGIWHIVFNMLFLWWFGHEMEEMYGPREFTIFYLVSAVPGRGGVLPLGLGLGNLRAVRRASGAVTAVMVAVRLPLPDAHHLPDVVPADPHLAVRRLSEVCFRTLSSSPRDRTRPTAVTVHLAGAAFGFGYYKGNWRLAPLWQASTRSACAARRPPSASTTRGDAGAGAARRPHRPPRPDRRHRRPPPSARRRAPGGPGGRRAGEGGRSGRDSLTESEKALLVRASEVYKRKQRS